MLHVIALPIDGQIRNLALVKGLVLDREVRDLEVRLCSRRVVLRHVHRHAHPAKEKNLFSLSYDANFSNWIMSCIGRRD